MLLALTLAAAPPQNAEAPVATCAELLSGIQAKTEANYAGFLLEITGKRRRDYDALLVNLKRSAAAISPAGCFPVLDSYVESFNDPHLFVYQSPRLDTAETRRRILLQRQVTIDESAVRAGIARQGKSVDPIQGIWTDRGRRIAVIPDPDGTRGKFLGVILVSDTVTFPVGMVTAVFHHDKEGYRTTLTWPSLAVTYPPTALHRGGTLLRISPTLWGKRYPGAAEELALLDSANVRRPTLTWRNGNVAIFSVTSHDPGWRPTVDSLVTANRERLSAAAALIIDLRGNEGGGSQTTAALNPYLVDSASGVDPQSPNEAVMLSSPDQITYARRAFGPDTSAFVRRLVHLMEATPRGLVLLIDPADTSRTPRPTPLYGPKQIMVLIDGGTVSASEVTVLVAKAGRRAVVFGEPTAGALDYQSTSIVRIVPGESRRLLGYPTITANAQLPKDGMRGKGIAPDVDLKWPKVNDPIAAVLEKVR